MDSQPAAMDNNADRPAPSTPNNGSGKWRRLGLGAIFLTVLIAAAAYAWWWYENGLRYVSTDNAYVQGHLLQVTAQTAGTVVSIHADETDRAVAGQTLIALDPTDARLAVAQAEAQLAQAVRELQTVYAADGGLRAQINLRTAELGKAHAEQLRAAGDLKRRMAMARSGAISDEEIRHAQAAAVTAQGSVTASQAALELARETRSASRMLVDGTALETHPNVQRAALQLREAHVALRRATIAAPISGHVARRSVQVGQRVAAGTALMVLVALDQVWVEANFKESQLGGLRIGQPVQLSADLYGDSVHYQGIVTGLAAGTGSAFALLPAQNATGNWIKVIQRLPVRIALDAKQLAAKPLRVGLSMRVQVDVSNRDGKPLADLPPTKPAAQTLIFDSTQADIEVDAAIARIIRANLVVPAATSMRQQP